MLLSIMTDERLRNIVAGTKEDTYQKRNFRLFLSVVVSSLSDLLAANAMIQLRGRELAAHACGGFAMGLSHKSIINQARKLTF